MTRDEAVIKAINEGVRIKPPDKMHDFKHWTSWNFQLEDDRQWEIEDQKVTITLEQFNKAYNMSLSRDELKNNLGFK